MEPPTARELEGRRATRASQHLDGGSDVVTRNDICTLERQARSLAGPETRNEFLNRKVGSELAAAFVSRSPGNLGKDASGVRDLG